MNNRSLNKSFISAAAALFLASSTIASDIYVQTLTDVDSNCTTGDCSLRDALSEALSGDTILFDVNGTIEVLSQLPDINKSLTITGNGPSNTIINSDGYHNIFNITNSAANVNISNLSLTGATISADGGAIHNVGTLTLSDASISNISLQSGGGGGIYNEGTVTIQRTVISGNEPSHGKKGGALYNTGTATVIDSNISNNNVNCATGGGIYNDGTLTIQRSTISGNTAIGTGGDGGGIYDTGSGTVSISESNITNNEGGGVYGYSNSTIDINNTIFSGNNIFDQGGALYKAGGEGTLTIKGSSFVNNYATDSTGGKGGAIYNEGNSTILNTTFSSNSAKDGGAVYTHSGDMNISFSTISANRSGTGGTQASGGGIYNNAATVNIKNSIVAANIDIADHGNDLYGTFNLVGTNIIGDSEVATLTGDISSSFLDINASLGTLTLVGSSYIHMPNSDSPAINTATCTDLTNSNILYDQTGTARYDGVGCDLGAVDFPSIIIDLNVTNLSLSNNDITGISLISQTKNNRSFDITAIADGNNNFKTSIPDTGIYGVRFDVDAGTGDIHNYWYKITDTILYERRIDQNNFITELNSTNNEILMDLQSNNWVDGLDYEYTLSQTVDTNGSADWESFMIGSDHYLAVANFNNETTKNLESKIYKFNGINFEQYQTLPTSGGYDIESFEINGNSYLAVANYMDDTPTYNQNSNIYVYNGSTSLFEVNQTLPTSGARDFESFELNGEHYLAVANYFNGTDHNISSNIYRFNPSTLQFEVNQTIDTNGSISIESFDMNNEKYLAVANNYNGTDYNISSNIYKYNGSSFEHFQSIDTNASVDFESFNLDGETYLAVANNSYGGTDYTVDSHIYKFNGSSFNLWQTIPTSCAHKWKSFSIFGEDYLAVANCYDNSIHNIDSVIYKYNGSIFTPFQNIATNSAYDIESFTINNTPYLAVANYFDDSTTNISSKIYKAENFKLNLTNIDLSENNITNITVQSQEGNITFDNILDADNNLSYLIANDAQYISVKVDLNDSTSWWYNFTEQVLYEFNDLTENFKTFISDSLGTTVNMDMNSSNFLSFQNMSVHHNLPIVEFEINGSVYDNATAKDMNMSELYLVYTYYENNESTQNPLDDQKVISIQKAIPDTANSRSYESEIEIYEGIGMIKKVHNDTQTITIDNNVVTIPQSSNIYNMEVKYIEDLDNSTLTSIYNGIDLNVTFPSGSTGYRFYFKQLSNECELRDNYTDTTDTYSSIGEFVTEHSYGNGYNFIMLNEYNRSKALMFENSNDIVEVNLNNMVKSNVGTWSEATNVTCTNEDEEEISVASLIDFNLSVDGYPHLAYGLINSQMVQGEYRTTGDTNQYIHLNKTAAQYLASEFGLTTTPVLNRSLTNEWTYMSLPTNMTLCSSTFRDDQNLNTICNQDYSIEGIFSDVDIVLKNTGYWSYWDDSNNTYNMSKLSSINHKEGLLIKTTPTTVLSLPYDIFNLRPNDDLISLPKEGWYLLGTTFKQDLLDIKTDVENKSRTLKYILNYDVSWSIYAPTNDSQVTSTLPRIDRVEATSGYWIYVQ
ncbi:MAG: right-handed parallel beta-helix repeat-containing protein [Campylobacterota bacterium]|nr:right-handed parallel beta-helix repeat-containing protein [Campylobacterota bacterium]